MSIASDLPGGVHRSLDPDAKGIGAVILAAGASTRMGRPKQAIPFRGESLLRRAALAAVGAGCRPVIVVTGAHAELSRRELLGLNLGEIFNPDWEEGMGTSIAAGIAALEAADPAIRAAVILLCDQPFADSDIVRSLIETHRGTGKPIAASEYCDAFGAPALFSRSLFSELKGMRGNSGAKQVIKRHAAETAFVPFPEGAVDVDTPADLGKLISSDPEQEQRNLGRSRTDASWGGDVLEMGPTRGWIAGSAPARIILGFLLAASFLAAAGWLVTGPLRGYPEGADAAVRGAVRRMQSPMWTSLFLAATKLGSTLYLTIVGSAAGLIFIALRWFRPLLLFIIAMTGQAALHHGFKWLFARPRPPAMIAYPTAEGYSFPSGHALSGLCLYVMIAWIVTNRLDNPAVKAGIWIFTIVLVFLIGASRVYIGIHHPSDVAAGWLAAAIWTAAVMAADERRL